MLTLQGGLMAVINFQPRRSRSVAEVPLAAHPPSAFSQAHWPAELQPAAAAAAAHTRAKARET